MLVGVIKARFAVLADHYHLKMHEIALLTDRTIADVYFHARDDKGAILLPVPKIEIPEREETLETALADLAFLKANGLITEQNYDECVVKARERFKETQ